MAKRNVSWVRVAVLVSALAAAVPRQAAVAQSISGLFASGVDGAGGLLTPGGVDPHYSITASGDPAFPGPDAFVVLAASLPGAWVDNTTASQWLSAQSGNSANAAAANFTFTTKFQLTQADPALATLSGSWSCDNPCVLQLNGTQVAALNSSTGYTQLHSFNVPAGSPFVSGENTLSFVVTNQGGPMGLRVETLTGTAQCSQSTQCSAGNWCNTVTANPAACAPSADNGAAIPEQGTCVGGLSDRCVSGACDTDNLCGVANGSACTLASQCRSTLCGANGLCTDGLMADAGVGDAGLGDAGGVNDGGVDDGGFAQQDAGIGGGLLPPSPGAGPGDADESPFDADGVRGGSGCSVSARQPAAWTGGFLVALALLAVQLRRRRQRC